MPEWNFDLMIPTARKLAEHADAIPGLPFWPTLPTGYDDTSRAFHRAWGTHSRTPAKCLGAF